MNNEGPQTTNTGVGSGVALGFALNIAYMGLWCALWFNAKDGSWMSRGFGENVPFYSIFGIGITQLLYMLPTIVYFQRKQRPEMVNGLIIAAAVTALLNGACWVALRG
jgi:hypothetical protein